MLTDNDLAVLPVLKWAKIERLSDMPAVLYGKAFNAIQGKIAAKAAKL